MKWDSGWCAAAVIAAAGLAAYAGSFSGVFVLDDVPSIVDNPTIRHLTDVRAVLGPPAGNGLTVDGRPLLNLSLAVNYAISGTRVWSYHALNLAIHILAGLALFGIVRRTLEGAAGRPRVRMAPLPGGPGLPALAVALLWVLHPIQTESVTYVVQRAESLMGLFYLLTLYCFIRYADCRSRSAGPAKRAGSGAGRWAGLSVACCLLGAASKEVMVSAPLMVWLYDRTFVSGTFRKAWREHTALYAGLASSWLLLGWLALGTNARGNSVGFESGVSWPAYALTQFGAVAHYLRLSFWPRPLVFDYGLAVAGRLGDVAPQLAVVVLLLAATLVALRRWPSLGFCGAWFFAILAPTSSVVPVGTQTMAEHRMYLPLAAVVTLAVLAMFAVAGRRSLPVLSAAALCLGLLTARRNEDYRSAVSIWRDTVSHHPESWRGQSNLGAALAEDPGRLPEAIAHYEEALRLKPDSAEVHNNLAIALARIPGRLPEAVSHYGQALRLRPNYAEAHNNLANALAKVPGRLPEAIAQYEEALRLNPDAVEAHYNLANALAKDRGRLPEAIAQYEEALRLNPDYAEAHFDLADALAGIPGRSPEAISHYEAALRLRPDDAEAHNNLATTLARIPGRLPEAVSHFEEALRLKPDYAEAHNNLANALSADSARLPEAISHYEEALRLKPDYAEAQFNLANALARDPGRRPEAVSHFEEALRLKPDYVEAHNNLATVLADAPGRVPEAISHFEEAIRLRPDYADAHNNLAIVLASIPGRLPEAIAQYEELLRIRPDYAEAHNNLANALAETPGRLSEAIPQYQEALRLKPDYIDAHCNLAAAYERAGRFDEAIAQLETALRLNPALSDARDSLNRLRALRR
ncbi:MAG: tetratricopeptide repeat protein [Opitutaceae bacterium]|jgi:tetratricopeptide (TPR) repeat protein